MTSVNKRALHHTWTKLRPMSWWYFFALFLLSGAVAIFALRQNNLNAITLKDKVIEVDKQNGDVEAALRELRTYVYGHMNTHLSGGTNAIYPPVQLKYRYERLVRAEKERISKLNEKVYTEAQTICEQRFPVGRIANRVPCVEDYVAQHSVKENPVPDALYKFDFQPPLWSFDLAGISLIVSCLFFLLFVTRFLLERWMQIKLNNHS